MKLSQKGRTGFYKSNVDDVAKRYDDINGMVNAFEMITRSGERFVQLGEKKQKRRLYMNPGEAVMME